MLLQIGVTTFNQLLHPVNSYLNSELNRQLLLNVQIAIFGKINHLASLAPFENPQTHNLLQKAVQGAQFGPSQALGTLTGLLHSTTTLVGFLGVLTTFNPLLAGLVALATLPELFAQIKMGRQRYRLVEANTPKQRYVGYYGGIFSAPYFAKELRLFNLGNYFLTRFRNLTKELNYSQRAQDQSELRWQAGLELFTKLVVSAAFVVVVTQAFQGYLSLGDVTLYTNAISSVQAALSGMVFALANIHESALFFSHYTRLLALPQPINIASTPQPTLPLVSAIELHRVSFRYSEEHPWILKNINLTLPAGHSLALVGLNGAGKTTLVKLLTRLYDPTEGQILWDGIDIREFDPVELRRRMGVIFQDFVRFELTALENIALGDVSKLENGNRAAAEAAARHAAQKAGIHEMVSALPHGYHTPLSRWLVEDGQGVDLSGGEWQKIALARLFMREADLLILDEPTAAMDAQAEHDIYQSFTEIVAGKTSLLISHRFSTVRMADLIAVLENGKITEYGSHNELMSKGGTYARLYKLQAERYR
ncbi:MAG: ABC transporter ATP-binding protein [Anaerolineales bacterium]